MDGEIAKVFQLSLLETERQLFFFIYSDSLERNSWTWMFSDRNNTC